MRTFAKITMILYAITLMLQFTASLFEDKCEPKTYRYSETYNYNEVKYDTSNGVITYQPEHKSYHKIKYNSYDKGYEDITENEDYDEERYENDSDYAAGVDDAIDESEEEIW